MNITKRYVVIFFSSDVNKVIVQLRRFGFIRYVVTVQIFWSF